MVCEMINACILTRLTTALTHLRARTLQSEQDVPGTNLQTERRRTVRSPALFPRQTVLQCSAHSKCH
jgi:hypothetical protein